MTGSDLLALQGFVAPGRGLASGMVVHNHAAIKSILGAEPYPGTLNIGTNQPFILRGAVTIDEKRKQFVVPGRINGTPCLLYRWHGAPLHVIEIIAASRLRDTLGLSDGQPVEISCPKDKIAFPGKIRSRLWELFYKNRPGSYYDDTLHSLFISNPLKYFHKQICQFRPEFRGQTH